MSTDARAWKEGAWWTGTHDGDCMDPEAHRALELEDVLTSLKACYGEPLYWEFRSSEQRGDWLAGYHYPRGA